jgi:hypothetical protein
MQNPTRADLQRQEHVDEAQRGRVARRHHPGLSSGPRSDCCSRWRSYFWYARSLTVC